ncbi:MAG: hypothetical protein K9L62_01930 [Vallitaleaceae bacterium]|nr:hypothetical protein [Vallitaleaceae bacterium]
MKIIKVMTRLTNEDNLKITRLIESYVKSGKLIYIESMGNDIVKVSFLIKRSLLKQFRRQLSLLNALGIEGTEA